MKKIVFSFLVIGLLSSLTYSKGKDKKTFIEKVEANKPVKVFFNYNTEIIDKSHEKKLNQADKNAKTDCRSTFPSGFYNSTIKDGIISHLNSGLELEGAFVEGDISSVPEDDLKMGGLDLSSLEDGFYAVFYVDGDYTRFLSKKEVEGKTVFEYKNNLQIMSKLFFYEVVDHKMKAYGSRTGLVLGLVSSSSLVTSNLENTEYMQINFPASALLDSYTQKSFSNVDDFTRKKLKKHKKVISKR